MRSALVGAAWLVVGCGGIAVVDAPGGDGGGGDGGNNTGGSGGDGAFGGFGGGCTGNAQCPPPFGCEAYVCDAGQCVAVPVSDGTPCEDGLFCTSGDVCQGGACLSGPDVLCPPPPGPCQAAACDEASAQCILIAVNDGVVCAPPDPCGASGVCSGGACLAEPPNCGALSDACNDGICTAMGCQLVPKPNGSACNDGNVCTGADACDAGVCIGSAGPLVYFSEDFSDNGAGWSLDPEWQIGSATGSMGHNFGNPDPAQDHSPGNNNGVAGVTLGGNVAISMSHDFYWLTSPPFNATIDPGPVLLSFRRWLNSDWMRWMNNRVEVFNGASWITIWESGNQPVTDTGWTLVEHDLSAHKNAAMRVRFGFSVGQLSGIFTVSGWNIDDVALAVATCP